jgi:hypothetical protein
MGPIAHGLLPSSNRFGRGARRRAASQRGQLLIGAAMPVGPFDPAAVLVESFDN